MEGQKGTVFVEQTPFYATMGGQVGDTGVIQTANGRFVVEDTIKLRGGKFGHVGYMESGMISRGRDRFSDRGQPGKKRYREEPQCYTSASEGIKGCTWCTCRAEGFPGNTRQTAF